MTMTDDEVRRINLLEILTSEEYPWVPPLPPALAAAWSEDSLRNFYQTAPPADVMHAWRPRGAVERFDHRRGSWVPQATMGEGTAARLGVVLMHPHPHMGGSKGNNVVEALWASLQRNVALCVCRYNSSGVGGSHGTCLADVQSEVADCAAVCAHLRQHYGCAMLVLVGYSFGALVAHAAAAETAGVVGYALVSFPYLMAPSRFPVCAALPKLLLMGDNDDVSLGVQGLAKFQHYADHLPGAQLQVTRGVNHFWVGAEASVVAQVQRWLFTTILST